MSDDGIGIYPGGTNRAFIHLTGTIVSWWARIEGLMVHDIMALRTYPFSASIVSQERFPISGKAIIKQWRRLLKAGYGADTSQNKKIDDAAERAFRLIEHRNQLVHSFWPYGQNDLNVLELQWIRPDPKGDFGVRRGTYTMTVSELDCVNQSFAHLYHAVMAISFNSIKMYRNHRTD